jgi:hypothetical protein
VSISGPACRSCAVNTPAQQHGQLLPGGAGALQTSPALQQRLAARARALSLSEDLSRTDVQTRQQPCGQFDVSSSTYLTPAAQSSQHTPAGTMSQGNAGRRQPAQLSECINSSSSAISSGVSKAQDQRKSHELSELQAHRLPKLSQQGRTHSAGGNASPARMRTAQTLASSRVSPGIGRHRFSDFSCSRRPIDTAAHGQRADSHRSQLVRAAAAAEAQYRAQNQQSTTGAGRMPPGHSGMCADSPVLCGSSSLLHCAATESNGLGQASRASAHQSSGSTAFVQDFPAQRAPQQHRQQSSCDSASSSARGMSSLQQRPCSAHAAFQTPAGHLCAAYAAASAGQHAHMTSNRLSSGAPTLYAASAPSRPAQQRCSRHAPAHSADFQQQQQHLLEGAAVLQEVVAPWKLSAWLMKADVRARPQRLVRRARAVNLSSESGDAAADSDSSSGSSGSDGSSSLEWVSPALHYRCHQQVAASFNLCPKMKLARCVPVKGL